MQHPLLDDGLIGRIGIDCLAVLAAVCCRTLTDTGLETWFVRVAADGLLDDFGAISRVHRVIAVAMKNDGRHAPPLVGHNLTRDASDQRGLAAVPILVFRAEPVPAL